MKNQLHSVSIVTFGQQASTCALNNAEINIGLPTEVSAVGGISYEHGAVSSENTHRDRQQPKLQMTQTYLNPFNPSTNIVFRVVQSGIATLRVYDGIGREVTELFNRHAEPGIQYTVLFYVDRLSSGVYFSVLQSGSQRITTKMLLMK
jgi:hypothetical protein